MSGSEIWKEWTYSVSDVEILPTVLGRGAFGEVRLAKWRGTTVAAKRLHVVSDNLSAIETIRCEVDLMSRLRHPNLLLFIGVCFDPQPVMITELMPCSLYDVLESAQRTSMSFEEILDITIDVSTGLEYLHGRSPVVIHRDISSKNILLGGNKAKIADLGQAKMFGDEALSRQTGMPGAMAYAAPEILTGRYTEKIDIFSLGVLLVQMCCGEYPRIDKREEHLHQACSKYSIINSLMTSMLSYQPNERPSASQVRHKIDSLMANDRYYSPSRKTLPQSDIGILGYRWLQQEIEVRNKDIKLALEQTGRRLTAEEQRYKSEAQRLDQAKQTIIDMEQDKIVKQQEFRLMQSNAEDLQKMLEAKTTEFNELQRKFVTVSTNDDSKQKKNEEYLQILETQQQTIHHLEHKKHESSMQMEQYIREISSLRHSLEVASEKDKQQQAKIEELQSDNNELEARLEQILVRWQSEKESTMRETQRCNSLKHQMDEVKHNMLVQKEELETVLFRLKQYDSLPLPEEIKIRMKDMEDDIVAYKLQRDASQQTIHEKTLEVQACKETNEQLNSEFVRCQEEVISLNGKIEEIELSKQAVEEECSSLKEQLREANEVCAQNDATIGELMDSITSLQEKSKEFEEKYLWEKRCREQEGGSSGKTTKKPQASSLLANLASGIVEEQQIEKAEGNAGDPTLASNIKASVSLDVEGSTEGSSDAMAAPATAPRPSRAATATNIYNFSAESATSNQKRAKDLLANVNKEEEEEQNRDNMAKNRVELCAEHSGGQGLYDMVTTEYMKENPYVIWRSLRALREVLIKDSNFHEFCVRQRFDKIVLECMSLFPKSTILQAQALRVLAALAYGNDKMRRYLGEQGTVAVVVKCMETYTEDEVVQLHACTTLTNMFHNSLENRSRFIECGGIDILVGHMDLYAQNSKYQRQALWAMLTLAATDEMSRSIVMKGASGVILNAMINHSDDAAIQQFSCWTICNLAIAGEDIRRKLKKCGFEELSKMAIEMFPEEEEVVRYARNALGVLNPAIGASMNNAASRANESALDLGQSSKGLPPTSGKSTAKQQALQRSSVTSASLPSTPKRK